MGFTYRRFTKPNETHCSPQRLLQPIRITATVLRSHDLLLFEIQGGALDGRAARHMTAAADLTIAQAVACALSTITPAHKRLVRSAERKQTQAVAASKRHDEAAEESIAVTVLTDDPASLWVTTNPAYLAQGKRFEITVQKADPGATTALITWAKAQWKEGTAPKLADQTAAEWYRNHRATLQGALSSSESTGSQEDTLPDAAELEQAA